MAFIPQTRVRLHPETFAITAVTHGRRLFQRTDMAELFIATISRYRSQNRFLLHAFVVMPDHIHILVTPAPDHTIERCVALVKGGFSFAARKQTTGEIWQDSYHAHHITSPEDYANQLQYIANNPSRKSNPDHPHVHTHHPHLLDPRPT